MSLLLTGLTAVLRTAANGLFNLDQHAKSQLRDLAGKVLAVEFTDIPLQLYFVPGEDELQVYGHYDGAVDTRLRGTSVQLLAMGVSAKPGVSLFKGEVSIEGDTDLGQRFQDILRHLDIDWEEHVSYVLGDVAAHKAGNALRNFLHWGRQGADSLLENIAEYFQYESNTVPARFEIDSFNHEVDVLRNDVERLQARIRRLTSRVQNPSVKAVD